MSDFSIVYFIIFFFKQKTAYEMRISDWSSDVCSSDLISDDLHVGMGMRRKPGTSGDGVVVPHPDRAPTHAGGIIIIREGEMMAGVKPAKIGRASWRERVCSGRVDPGGCRRLKKKKNNEEYHKGETIKLYR